MNLNGSANNDVIQIKYRLLLNNGTEKVFDIKLNSTSAEYISKMPPELPQWTELDFHKCPNCPLDPTVNMFCPAAISSMELIEFFKDLPSIEPVCLRVETEQRNYSKNTDMQTAATSLLGIIMATSRCPILSKLKPMARFHLPFASIDETRYRTISMYLLGQFFLLKEGKKPDWDLTELKKLNKDINWVNIAFIARLRHIHVDDSAVNALIRLTTFDQDINFTITEDSVTAIEQLFQTFLASGSTGKA
jgi:hypothetical protein